MNVAYYFQMSDKIVDTIDNSKKNISMHITITNKGLEYLCILMKN